MTGSPTQVFQMRPHVRESQTIGCVLADEQVAADETYSFFYAIPWRPDLRFETLEIVMSGEKHGFFTEFPLHFDGQIFIESELGLRFAFHDSLSPHDFRGLPFLRSFPYIGERQDILAWYGVTEFLSFLQIVPLDLIKMDELFINAGMIFTGITAQFGRHTSTQSTAAESAAEQSVSPALKKVFIGKLSDLYDAEHQWIAALPNIATASASPDVKNALDEHLRECRLQINRLNEVFDYLGAKPYRAPCRAMTGLVAEGEELIRANDEPDILDTGLIDTARTIVHFEIGEYGAVRTMAEALGLHEAASNLEQGLRQKEQANRKFRFMADSLLRNMTSPHLRRGDFESKV